MTRNLFLVAAVLGLSAVSALPAAAQYDHDCGNECRVCGDSKWEGREHATNGPYNMYCVGPLEEAGCGGCPIVSRSDKAIDGMVIARIIELATVKELGAVAAAYRDRLLFDASRKILVVKGVGCDPNALGPVVFLSQKKARAFARLNTPGLEMFLAAAGTARPST